MKARILRQCQALFPEWREMSVADFEIDDPKGFSSFTLGIRSKKPADPPAIFYRRLEGKENAILDFETEKEVFLLLGAQNIAADCHYYDKSCRIESFYQGRSLVAEDLFEPDKLRQIANRLYRFHQLKPANLPRQSFFELLHEKWGRLARYVLEEKSGHFPPDERVMCEELREIYSPDTLERVRRQVPPGEPTFCHNDTYHGNIMQLESGEIRLLDFEFSCINNKAYDFSNLFAETVMEHKLPEYPFFRIAEPRYGEHELGILINFYLDNIEFPSQDERDREFRKLIEDTKRMLVLSDYKYALAALPLAVEPIQKIRFIPYAYQRFKKFLAATDSTNPAGVTA